MNNSHSAAKSLDLSRLQSLIELSIILGALNDFQRILKLTARAASNFTKAETAKIIMINPQTRKTVKTIFAHSHEADEQQEMIHNLLSGWVIRNNRALLSADITHDERFRSKAFKSCHIRAVLCVPLKIGGLPIGTILVLNRHKNDPFSEADLAYLRYLAAISAPFLHNSQNIERYFAVRPPEHILITKYQALGLLGKSKAFLNLLQAVEAAAGCDVRVLLQGASGTGKERIVRAIHQFSTRSAKKFIAIDCGAIPANLIESELFGHVKGAFTGASVARKGLLEEANGGTLFMDEIGNLPPELQGKLLRLLQEGEIRPLGGNETRKVDVRIVAATSASLHDLVKKGQFREDLFYRLNVFPIEVPSLEERREDIPLLARHFLQLFSAQQNKQISSFDDEVTEFLIHRNWPGNIRELENLVERLVTLSPKEAGSITMSMLPDVLRKEWQSINKNIPARAMASSLEEQVKQLERKLILKALEENDWNQSRAARTLGISEQTIRYKISKLGIKKIKF